MTDHHNVEPLFTAPPLSCDAHFHIFGPAARYPHGGVDEKLRYAPPLAPLEDYLVQARRLGFERFVFVQPSAYGRDNAYMLDAMARLPGNRGGIVDVDQDAPDAVLAALDAAGVRGVRINVSPVKPPKPDSPPACCRASSGSMHVAPKSAGTWISSLPGWLTQELMGYIAPPSCPVFARTHGDVPRRRRRGPNRISRNSSICCAMARDGPG